MGRRIIIYASLYVLAAATNDCYYKHFIDEKAAGRNLFFVSIGETGQALNL